MGRAYEVRAAAMAKTAAKKSKIYAKYGRLIYLAAKSGEPDPDINSNLRREIEKAKKENVPSDIIKRAIEKAIGGIADDYFPTRYEGFGPNNSMFIVECLTDNSNRTFADVRVAFTRSKMKMGVDGSVVHMFKNQAVFSFEGLNDEETLELLIEADCEVDDIEYEEGLTTVYAPNTEYAKVRDALVEAMPEIQFLEDHIAWVPIQYTTLSDSEDIEQFEKFKSMLDDIDEFQDLYHNVIIDKKQD